MSSDQSKGFAPYAEHASSAAGWTNVDIVAIVQNNQRASVALRALRGADTFAADQVLNKRFGAPMRIRRIDGDRTREVSLAPKLIAEGGNA